MTPLLILNYHRITLPNEQIDPRYRNFTLDKDAFRRQLQTIRELEIPVIDLRKLQDIQQTSSPINLALTFDDGHLSDYSIVADLLVEFKFPAAFFPVISHIDKPGYLSWEQLKRLQECGFLIGSHSNTHPILTRLDRSMLEQEIRAPKQMFSDKLNTDISLFSIPFGRYSNTVLEVIRSEGHQYALSTNPGLNYGDSFLLKRSNIKASTSPEDFYSLLHGERNHIPSESIILAKRMLQRFTDVFHT